MPTACGISAVNHEQMHAKNVAEARNVLAHVISIARGCARVLDENGYDADRVAANLFSCSCSLERMATNLRESGDGILQLREAEHAEVEVGDGVPVCPAKHEAGLLIYLIERGDQQTRTAGQSEQCS